MSDTSKKPSYVFNFVEVVGYPTWKKEILAQDKRDAEELGVSRIFEDEHSPVYASSVQWPDNSEDKFNKILQNFELSDGTVLYDNGFTFIGASPSTQDDSSNDLSMLNGPSQEGATYFVTNAKTAMELGALAPQKPKVKKKSNKAKPKQKTKEASATSKSTSPLNREWINVTDAKEIAFLQELDEAPLRKTMGLPLLFSGDNPDVCKLDIKSFSQPVLEIFEQAVNDGFKHAEIDLESFKKNLFIKLDTSGTIMAVNFIEAIKLPNNKTLGNNGILYAWKGEADQVGTFFATNHETASAVKPSSLKL